MTFLSQQQQYVFRKPSAQIQVRFLKRFEQLEHTGERLPRSGAFGAYPSLEPPIRSSVDVEEKASRLPRP
jgi:hypothetical protein